MLRRIISLILFIPMGVCGQQSYHLLFHAPNKSYYSTVKNKELDSREEVKNYLAELQHKYREKGFVLASIDSLNWKKDTAYVRFFIGKHFDKISITYKEEDAYIISKVPKMNERLISHFPFKAEMVTKMLKGLSDYLNNNGYPFSKVYLTMDTILPKNSEAHLHIEKGPIVYVSKIFLKGEPKIRKKYIMNAISIKEGDIYSADKLRMISSKIEQIQFVQEIRTHELLFTPKGVEIYLYLKSSPVSLVNGIVGLQPNPVTEKTTFTGKIRLKLLNILKRGESLDIQWESLQPGTQKLNIGLNYPFLFNTPFGIDGNFNLYKQDSTYITTKFHIGVQYFFSGGSYVKAFYQVDKSNLLSGAKSIPNSNLSTISTNNYGIGFYRSNVDYLPNPGKGFIVEADVAAGTRKSRPAATDTTIKSTVFKVNFNISYFVPITHRNVIRLGNTTRSYYAPKIYQNELFRFGGLQTQRGFNEESLLATTLTTFTVEYRFLVNRDSHAFAFFDQTFYENNSRGYTRDHPYGFGLGYAFGTNLGIFSISYALGSQMGNPIKFRNGKVHFGYIAYF